MSRRTRHSVLIPLGPFGELYVAFEQPVARSVLAVERRRGELLAWVGPFEVIYSTLPCERYRERSHWGSRMSFTAAPRDMSTVVEELNRPILRR